MSKLEEKVIHSELVYQGGFLKINRDQVMTPDGQIRRREYILHPGASAIVPVLPDGRLVMEKQYRHAVRKTFLEFPAGKLDKGENTLEAAKRELKEETGYEAAEWRHLTTIHPAIGYSDEFIEIYLAKDLAQKGAQLDPGEHLEVVTLSLDELLAAVRRGEVTDVKTLGALYWYEKVLNEGW